MRWFLLALFAFGLVGCLNVDSADGALICNDDPLHACPQGFYCLATSNRCWRDGHFPDDMAMPVHFNPGPPDDLSVPSGSDLSPGDDQSLSTTSDDLSSTD